eukprot:189946-Rhodomonas_salina.2
MCKDCGGSQICEHRRVRSQCKECGWGSICEHNRRRSKCKECKIAKSAQNQEPETSKPGTGPSGSHEKVDMFFADVNPETGLPFDITIEQGLETETSETSPPDAVGACCTSVDAESNILFDNEDESDPFREFPIGSLQDTLGGLNSDTEEVAWDRCPMEFPFD